MNRLDCNPSRVIQNDKLNVKLPDRVNAVTEVGQPNAVSDIIQDFIAHQYTRKTRSDMYILYKNLERESVRERKRNN